MFKKLLSNLPFNPSLVEQVAFYAKRLHREAFLRTVGAVLLILAVLLQLFAVVSPPQQTLAANGNDLIPGGVSSHFELLSRCNNNDYSFREIMAHYNIDCEHIAAGSVTLIRSTDYNRELYSMGRLPYGKAGEYPVNIGSSTFFMRYLWSWDSGGSSTYQALSGTSGTGARFFILFSCGNLVIIGKPTPPPPPPPPPQPVATKPVLRKSAKNITQKIPDANGTTAQPGDTIQYTLYAQNTGPVTIKDFVFQENIEDVLEYADIVSLHGGKINDQKVVSWPKQDIRPKTTITRRLTVKIVKPLPDTPRSTSNPGSYDLMLTNVYGNTVNIKLPNSPAKITETTVQTLPNTGPGTGLAIGFGLATIVGYFVARSRLMAKELDIAKQDAVSASH